MAAKNRAGIGGPKTEEGKFRSAQNSLKHGLTSSIPSSHIEAEQIADLTKELVSHHNPQSPLEFLQIDRIAACKARLSHLYEVEQTRLALAHKELDLHPEKILEKISGATGITKSMVLEIIEGQKISPPCNLEKGLLVPIVAETHAFIGGVASVQEFKKAFPVLTRYLDGLPVPGLNDQVGLPEKLFSVAQRVDEYLSLEGGYRGKLEKILYYQNLGMQYEVLHDKYENTGFEKEIAEFQKESRMRYGLSEKDLSDKLIKRGEPDFLSTNTLNANFKIFENLLHHIQKAEKVVSQFFELKSLMTRSITLPVAESDLLMRYQTTLERRLSSSIGELLKLQKKVVE